jgi:hypothetical protein
MQGDRVVRKQGRGALEQSAMVAAIYVSETTCAYFDRERQSGKK